MIRKTFRLMLCLLFLLAMLAACAKPTEMATLPPPTLKPVLPTPTPLPLNPTQVSPTLTATAMVKSTTMPGLGPSPRGLVSMAYDAKSDRVIIFGGQIGIINSGDYIDYDDTWAYDLTDNQWTQMKPLSVPTVRSGAELAYDVESDRVIMFGGFSSSIFWADEWAYDYNTNTWMKIAKGPGNRFGTSMAYDEESDRIILFGGWYMNMSGFIENDTWAYDF